MDALNGCYNALGGFFTPLKRRGGLVIKAGWMFCRLEYWKSSHNQKARLGRVAPFGVLWLDEECGGG